MILFGCHEFPGEAVFSTASITRTFLPISTGETQELSSPFLCLPKGRAYSRRFVYPFVRPSVRLAVRPKSFLPTSWTKFDKNSYMNSFGYCADALSRIFNLTLCHGKRRLNACFCQNFMKLYSYIVY